MKKYALYLALVCGALAGETPTIQPDATVTREASSLSFTVGTPTATNQSSIMARYLVIVQSDGMNPILRIGELPYEKIVNQQPNTLWVQPYRYLRPKTPDELKIELWTEDGKKWEPVWREVK